jgi:hypothetical protein
MPLAGFYDGEEVNLQELIPWPEGEKVCPAHQRMLDLMPEHLQWPDPIWGDTLFD